MLRVFAGLGAGADVVSEGELRRALAAGIPPERIIFSGVGKTRAELAARWPPDIHQINVESVPELRRLSEIAAARGRPRRIAIRVNPDVDALTHTKISTGRKERQVRHRHRARPSPPIASPPSCPASSRSGWRCISARKLVELGPCREAFARLAELVVALRGERAGGRGGSISAAG